MLSSGLLSSGAAARRQGTSVAQRHCKGPLHGSSRSELRPPPPRLTCPGRMSGAKSSRLTLRKPLLPDSAPDSAQPAPRRTSSSLAPATPSEAEAVTGHAVRTWQWKAAQLERALALTQADVRRGELLVADARTAIDGIRAHARAVAAAEGSGSGGAAVQKLLEYAESALRRLDTRPSTAGAPDSSASLDLPFQPSAGNMFLPSGGDDGAWSSERVTVSGFVSGEAQAVLDGARVAALSAQLVDLAPKVEHLAARLERVLQTESASLGQDSTGDLLKALLPQLCAAATDLTDLAQVTPSRGAALLFGASPSGTSGRPGEPPRRPSPAAASQARARRA